MQRSTDGDGGRACVHNVRAFAASGGIRAVRETGQRGNSDMQLTTGGGPMTNRNTRIAPRRIYPYGGADYYIRGETGVDFLG